MPWSYGKTHSQAWRKNQKPAKVPVKRPTRVGHTQGDTFNFPIGNLGMQIVLTPGQMKDLVNAVKTKGKLHGPGNSPQAKARAWFTKKQILDYWNKYRPQATKSVKRTKSNDGSMTRKARREAKLPLKQQLKLIRHRQSINK